MDFGRQWFLAGPFIIRFIKKEKGEEEDEEEGKKREKGGGNAALETIRTAWAGPGVRSPAGGSPLGPVWAQGPQVTFKLH